MDGKGAVVAVANLHREEVGHRPLVEHVPVGLKEVHELGIVGVRVEGRAVLVE